MAEQLVHLDPAKVLAEDNIRFGLKKYRVEALKASILESGGIQVPVEVEQMVPTKNGHTHRLTSGFYRHAAASELNAKEKAGLLLPAIVRQPADALDRAKRQLSENRDRENMSPMDEARAVDKLLKLGVAKSDVRSLFARPSGRKGITIQPASNSYINILLSFLELAKAIQDKIHDGRIGVKAAYELTRVPAEQRQAILDKAEADRQREMDREEKLDESDEAKAEREAKAAAKAAEKEAKLAEAAAKLDESEKALIEAKAKHTAAMATQKEAKTLVGADGKKLTAAEYMELTDEQKKPIAERIAAAKADERGTSKEVGKLQKALQKAQLAHKRLADPEPKEPTPPGASKSKKKNKAVSQDDIKAAARAAGVTTGPAPLTLVAVNGAIKELALSKFAKVKAIATLFSKLLDGSMNAKMVETDLTVLTGERKTTKA